MPPFQYQDFQDRYSGTIADLTARRGDVAAAGALRRGDAEARGTVVGTAALTNGIAGAAQDIAGIPQDLARAKAQETQQAAADLQLEDLKRRSAELKAMDAAYAQPGGREAVIEGLRKTAPHLIPEALKTFDALDKSHAEVTKLRDEADARAIEGAADVGAQIHKFGDDPLAAQLVLSDYKTKYAGDPTRLQQIQQLESALHADPSTETVKAMADALLEKSPTRRAEAEKAATLKRQQDRDAQLKANEDKIRQDTEARDAETIKNNAALREQGNKRLEIEGRNANTAAAREAREKSEHDAIFTGTGPDGQPKISPTAQLIADYKLPPPSPRSLDGPKGQALMAQVKAANPEYDSTQFVARSAMRKAYTSGNQSQQLGALNTAIEHLGKFQEVTEAMGNGSFKPGNELYNWFRTTFGSSAVTNFSFARDIMSGELATAMKKSGATDQEIQKVSSALDAAGSPTQLMDAIKVVAIPMIAGKAGTLEQQYHAVMGARDPFSVYTPGAKAVMDRIAGGLKNAAGGGGGVTVQAPNGQTFTFPNQQKADEFKRVAGIK